jgi:hypothetical protein
MLRESPLSHFCYLDQSNNCFRRENETLFNRYWKKQHRGSFFQVDKILDHRRNQVSDSPFD